MVQTSVAELAREMGSTEGHRVTGHHSQCIVADTHPEALSKSQAPWIASLIFLQPDCGWRRQLHPWFKSSSPQMTSLGM